MNCTCYFSVCFVLLQIFWIVFSVGFSCMASSRKVLPKANQLENTRTSRIRFRNRNIWEKHANATHSKILPHLSTTANRKNRNPYIYYIYIYVYCMILYVDICSVCPRECLNTANACKLQLQHLANLPLWLFSGVNEVLNTFDFPTLVSDGYQPLPTEEPKSTIGPREQLSNSNSKLICPMICWPGQISLSKTITDAIKQ